MRKILNEAVFFASFLHLGLVGLDLLNHIGVVEATGSVMSVQVRNRNVLQDLRIISASDLLIGGHSFDVSGGFLRERKISVGLL